MKPEPTMGSLLHRLPSLWLSSGTWKQSKSPTRVRPSLFIFENFRPDQGVCTRSEEAFRDHRDYKDLRNSHCFSGNIF